MVYSGDVVMEFFISKNLAGDGNKRHSSRRHLFAGVYPNQIKCH